MRTRIDGSGTYKAILPKIINMAESRNQEKYYVRGTFTRRNLDFSEDVLHLADKGFLQISVEPVVAAKDSGYDIREEDLPVLFEQYEKLAREYVARKKAGNGFNFFHFLIDLNDGPCILKKVTGRCRVEYVAVTPEGDIYPCHQFVGMEDFRMGNVGTGITKPSIPELFKGSNIYTKAECGECWAKYYCSGDAQQTHLPSTQILTVPIKSV
jgi:uncharacterized protein